MRKSLLKIALLLPLLMVNLNAKAIEQVDGWYQIGTPQDLTEFAEVVNGGDSYANAVLTADIDMGGAVWETPISYWSNSRGGHNYYGTFDGQGHFISNLSIEGQDNDINCGGLFGLGQAGSMIKNLTIKDCIFTALYSIGGIAGEWYGEMENCVTMNVKISGSAMYGLIGYGGTVRYSFTDYPDSYRPDATTAINTYGSNDLEEADYASGKLCYLLNKGLETPVWYQNIGEDALPVLDASHKTVNATKFNCDGTLADDCAFTNEAVQAETPAHQYEGACCVNCGAVNPDYTCEEEDGCYLLGNWDDLYWFFAQLNAGNNALNGKLTADIDNFTYPMMMKTDYFGKFDGNGHTITLNFENPGDFSGIFREVAEGAEVCNLTVRGTMTVGGQYCGGITTYISGTVRNCYSYVTINANGGGTNGGFAFMIRPTGLLENSLSAVTFNGENLSECAELVGWIDAAATTQCIKNCLCITEAEVNQGAGAVFYRGGNGNNLENSYYKFAHGATNGGIQITDEQLTNGEVCWMLNNKSFTNPIWFQTIGKDETPVTDPTHNIVLKVGDEYVSFAKEDYASSMKKLADASLQEVQNMMDEKLAYQPLIDAYKESIDAFANAASWDELGTLYQQMIEKKSEVQANMDAYAAYTAQADEIKSSLSEELSGIYVEILREYLAGYSDPNEDFPNGSYEYIMESKLLNTEEVFAESEFMKVLQERTLAGEALPGSDISVLLKNADFRSETLKWDGDMPVGLVPNLPVVECYQNTGELFQTITGLKNGLYEFTLNAWFRPAGNDESRMYTTFIFANDQIVPIMNVQEDPIAMADAVDMENSYITEPETYPYDHIYNENYFIPWSFTGAAYAFNGGRYLNRILVNVTDGTLKVGIRALGTGCSGDCLEFNNAKLYYLGDMNEANEGLTEVLAGQIARAKTLVETEVFFENYRAQPNYSSALRSDLSTLISTAETAENAEDKYNAIKALSPMFYNVIDGEKAYLHMMSEVGNAIEILSSDIFGKMAEADDALMEKLNAMGDAFYDGSVTTEEAWSFTSPFSCKMVVEDDYYLIEDASDLAWFARFVYNGNGHINGKVMNDIDMGGSIWKFPIGFWSNSVGNRSFYGTFDGQGHSISNLTIDAKDNVSCGGLFGLGQESAMIKNLILKDCTFTAPYSCGGVIGEWYGAMENCATINVTVEGSPAMGLVGYGGIVKNCYTTNADAYREGTEAVNLYGAHDILEDEYASGKLCYLLNQGLEAPVWFQTLGVDPYPVLDATHGTVVMNEDGTFGNWDAIESIAEKKVTGTTFNLMGQKVQKASNGIYIIDGRKVFVK